MTEHEKHQEHIQHTHNAFCKIVIRHAAIDAARSIWEISLDYLIDEKHYPFSTTDEYFAEPAIEGSYSFSACGQTVLLESQHLAAADMSAIEDRLNDVPGITGMISYHSLLGTGIPDFFIPEEVKDMLKQGGWQMMLVNSSYETASNEVAQQLQQITAIVKAYDPDALITGEAAMTEDLIQTTAVDFNVTNHISIAAIFLIVMVVFKSLSVPAVLVAVIEFAIFLNQGVPYFTGTEVPFVAPTVISCIQLGATVDYAILMTSRFQEELRRGKDRYEAALITGTSSDASIITSALVLFCATLGVSFVSSIDLIGSICIMLARGAVISAVLIIFLLPALLYLCEPIFNKTSLYWRAEKQKKSKAGSSQNQTPQIEEAPQSAI